jgi:3-hydroxyisobutyrate dehydrogenase-like beta-hydroxyacid dehydrogenase
MDVAKQAGLNVPMGELAQSLYSAHQKDGNGPRDFSSICEKYAK